MRARLTPGRLIAAGGALLLGAWLVLLLMVIHQLPASLPLAMGAYAASLVGLVIGLFGAVQYVQYARRSRPNDPDS